MSILPYQEILRLAVLTPTVDRTTHPETGMTYGAGPATYDVRLAQELDLAAGTFGLFSTMEAWAMPNNLCATIHDKSTLARRGLALQNTFVDPGFRGESLTLEISNHGRDRVVLPAGSPIAQVLFHIIYPPTTLPYDGQYQDQGPGPEGPGV